MVLIGGHRRKSSENGCCEDILNPKEDLARLIFGNSLSTGRVAPNEDGCIT